MRTLFSLSLVILHPRFVQSKPVSDDPDASKDTTEIIDSTESELKSDDVDTEPPEDIAFGIRGTGVGYGRRFMRNLDDKVRRNEAELGARRER